MTTSTPCPLCDGTGWQPVERDGVRRVARCECWYAASKQDLVAQARIPRRYEHCTLYSFVPYTRSMENALNYARAFVRDFPVVDHGILLLGSYGVGKTHLAVAILHDLLRTKSIGGQFYEFSPLLKLIRSTYDPISQFSETEVLQPVARTPLLVLDDVGVEVPSAWVRETFEYIINSRYSERRATILTSNFPDTTASEDTQKSFRERVGARMRSRLDEMCTKFTIEGLDLRERVASKISLSRQQLEHEWHQHVTRKHKPAAVAEAPGYFEKYPDPAPRPRR